MPNRTPLRIRHLSLLLLAACSMGASLTLVQAATRSTAAAPPASTSAPRSPAALQADALFWQIMHSGDYAHIQRALEATTAAHLRDPGDVATTAHIGFLHIWRLSERVRQGSKLAPTITDDAVLARSYFQRAATAQPDDPRYQGFLASAMLAEAGIQHDAVLRQQAMRTLRGAIKAWPAFNLFTAGYVMSNLDAASPGFRQALAWQWRNLDVCAREPVDRHHPDISRLSARIAATPADARDRRACNESAIAPHNQEGFFLNMGDMLVKSGDWQTARTIYAAAKSAPGYASWPFRGELERRIADAPANVAHFNQATTHGHTPPVRMMLNSRFACMACHQR